MSTTTAKTNRFPTRALLACVVLGALGAVIVYASRVLGLTLQAGVPWLSFPAPLPWFLGILIAPLLVQRVGAALLTSFVSTVIAFGALALCAGVVIEVAFILARWVHRRSGRELPPLRSKFWLWWAILTSLAVSLMAFGFMFLYQEFVLLDTGIKLLSLVIRLALGVLYAWLAWVIAIGLVRAGVNPQHIALG